MISGAVLGDLFFEVTKSPYIQIKQFQGILPPDYSVTNFTGAVSRMLKTGHIDKIIKEGEPYLRLTGLGKKALTRDFPLLLLREKKWDRLWRIVFYDVNEKQRSTRLALQQKLENLGFGRLQKSVYISPLPICEDLREFLENRGLSDFVFVGICRKLFAGDEKRLAARVWELGKLNEKYGEVLYDMDDFLAGRGEMNLSQLYNNFEQILLDDPFLPKELLPDWWLGGKAIRQMKELLLKVKRREK